MYQTNISDPVDMIGNDLTIQAFLSHYSDGTDYYQVEGHIDPAATLRFGGDPNQRHFEFKNDNTRNDVELYLPGNILQCNIHHRLLSANVDLISIEDGMIEGIFNGEIYRDYYIEDQEKIELNDTVRISNGYFKVTLIENTSIQN